MLESSFPLSPEGEGRAESGRPVRAYLELGCDESPLSISICNDEGGERLLRSFRFTLDV